MMVDAVECSGGKKLTINCSCCHGPFSFDGCTLMSMRMGRDVKQQFISGVQKRCMRSCFDILLLINAQMMVKYKLVWPAIQRFFVFVGKLLRELIIAS